MKSSSIKKLLILIVFLLAMVFAGLIAAVYLFNKLTTYKLSRQKAPEEMTLPVTDENASRPFDSGFDGLDISYFQGRIFWDSLRTENKGLKFLYIRATDINSSDSHYEANVNKAREEGMLVGSYHVFNMYTSVDKQFNVFKELVKVEHQDLRPMLDVEFIGPIIMSNEQFKDSVMRMARLMEEYYGTRPLIYSNQSFYKSHLYPEFNDYPLWIANYSQEPSIPDAKPIIWQYSDRGHVKGVWTNVDLDKFINGGSIKDLKR